LRVYSNSFTDQVAACIRKRSKAIKHRGTQITSDRIKEVRYGVEKEIRRLDIRIGYRVDGSRVGLRLTAWDDRWIWIHVRRHGKAGPVWSATAEGRFVVRDGAKDLVRTIEATLDASFEAEPSLRIEEIWKGVLARGPRPA